MKLTMSPDTLKYWLIWEYHTRIFSWSAQMEHAGSLLIKLSALGQGVLKTASFFRCHEVRRKRMCQD
ncbi:hypothetical protein VULLAG_LOCUS726 [Vulpes lagopus]